ncbi:hypothetical protein [uncultured Bradyrhizobium sp.]|uniref:hypothetical protein n=1 Tax=uncultured Bradyrhizobium sp. TaxID=199684 RepID=UPI0035CB44F1
MTQILKGRFDGSKAGPRARPVLPDFLVEPYDVDENGRRVLLGLTSAETREFETLDSLAPSDGNGDGIAWTFGGDPTTSREKRWLQLYTKHEEALRGVRLPKPAVRSAQRFAFRTIVA